MSQVITLRARQVVDLCPAVPFSFDATVHKPSHFPSTDNEWQPGVRWQTMLWQGQALGLKLEDRGTVDTPRIALSIWSQDELEADLLTGLVEEIRYRYNLALDLAGFNRRAEGDPQLAQAVAKWRGMRPMSYCSLYEYLVIAIVLQNATVRRSVNMLQALYERYGTQLAYDGKVLSCFWLPEAIDRASEEELRALKVGYRAKSLKRISAAFAQGEIDELALRQQTKEEQRQALLSLYGVGPASAGYILFDVFHHLDELSYISPWERRIYSRLFLGGEPDAPAPMAELIDLFERRFGEYKMLAVHYIWEDLFWQRKQGGAEWLAELIRL